MAQFSESTAADWDTNQSEAGVHHEQPAGTDWAPADQIEKGYATTIPNLIGYWPFDEDTGTTITDVVGGNHGTLTAATIGVPGILGTTAYTYDGVDDGGTIPDATTLEQTDTLTVAFWFKSTMASTGHTSVVRHDGHITPLQLSGGGNAHCVVWPAGSINTASFPWDATWNDGAWHFYVAQFDSTVGLNVYIDNMATPVATNTATGTLSTTTNPWGVGATEGGAENWAGTLDELMIFNTALSQTARETLRDTAAGVSNYWTDKKTI